MFEEFCIDIGDYHDSYLQCDTLLLEEVFEKFRDTCIDLYGSFLFIIWTWISMASLLKMTEVKLEL